MECFGMAALARQSIAVQQAKCSTQSGCHALPAPILRLNEQRIHTMISCLPGRTLAAAALAAAFLCTGQAQAAPPAPLSATPSATALKDQPWAQHGQGAGEQRFSPLAHIDRANVGQLGLAWSHPFRQPRGVEATPIVVGGVMYVTGPWSTVYALDARTGRELWMYDPKVPGEKAAHACCDVVNRGVAVHEGRVYVGTLDGRLVALDAKTGRERWSQRTFPIEETRTITGAPRVANGVVVIGHGGAEYGVRGFVAGYDARTGQRRWRFYTVPGNPATRQTALMGRCRMRRCATWRPRRPGSSPAT